MADVKSQALAIYLLGFSLRAVFGQSPVMPVQAEFLKPVQVHKVAAGATVFAKVTAEWNGPGCVLHPGAVLEGKSGNLRALQKWQQIDAGVVV